MKKDTNIKVRNDKDNKRLLLNTSHNSSNSLQLSHLFTVCHDKNNRSALKRQITNINIYEDSPDAKIYNDLFHPVSTLPLLNQCSSKDRLFPMYGKP
ncbi:hypothetical protein RclHR1_18190006 [Rhizophagus clarus]|uniref:Uncharacterized protein n=1 Tax=Rhizophagus clarus TaxID=94130 RepID=A0A2Z6R289_9GLOM|nr:hypothetical protein RclHR1_18190006 [Rhizophagus clarus]GES74111.1 hypothetical protein RCL_e5816_RclHR1_18190006 [Rhizophagus clarus]